MRIVASPGSRTELHRTVTAVGRTGGGQFSTPCGPADADDTDTSHSRLGKIVVDEGGPRHRSARSAVSGLQRGRRGPRVSMMAAAAVLASATTATAARKARW